MKRPLLIADDDDGIARSLERFFSIHKQPVVHATSVANAKTEIDGPTRWCGAVFDMSLPDGSGLTVLEAFREKWWTAPALVLTGTLDPEIINRAQALGAQFAVKPAPLESLRAFNQRLFTADEDDDVDRVVAQLADEFGLTATEVRVLTAAAQGVSREELPAMFDVSENTMKSQVRSLVRKCGQFQLGDVARLVWRRASR